MFALRHDYVLPSHDFTMGANTALALSALKLLYYKISSSSKGTNILPQLWQTGGLLLKIL